MKTALVTGASSGIGYACAEILAANGYNLILNARRSGRIEELSAKLSIGHNIKCLPLIFDVRDRNAVLEAIASIPENFNEIDLLINNAGLAAGLSELADGDIDDWDQMIDTNVKGLLYVSRAVIPRMKERGRGHIINIGSIAGEEVYPKGNVYCATKHAVVSLSKAMRMELVADNIKVTLVAPGAAETEFSLVRFKGDEQKAKNIYDGFEPLVANDIARCVEFCVNLPAHVNIDEIVVKATAQATVGLIHRKSLANR